MEADGNDLSWRGPAFSISGPKISTPEITDIRLTRSVQSHSASSHTPYGPPPPTPALLTRMLTAPKRSIVASAAACNSRFSDTSALTPAISALLGFSASTAHASAASSMSQSMTLAPARASALAMPSPMPDAAPVTNATLPGDVRMAALPKPKTFGKDHEAQKSADSEVRRTRQA